ncbi:MAG: Asp-tRNA(Asn)/Glu-tRNA(Gln) amidotransferase subunit GatC [Candidatus Nanohaloarchaea archaeon]
MRKEVEEVAENARINLKDEEAEGLAEDFEEILDMFQTLDGIDTGDVDPSFHPVEVDEEKRPDREEETITREEAFQNTENTEEGFFRGPSA